MDRKGLPRAIEFQQTLGHPRSDVLLAESNENIQPLSRSS